MSENTNIGLTAQAWADIVVERWEQKIVTMGIGSTQDLLKSFTSQVITDSGGNPELIRFAFNYYGRMVDMGVGKGVKASDAGLSNTTRKPKPWYNKTFAAQVHKLAEILAEKYAKKVNLIIVETITDKTTL